MIDGEFAGNLDLLAAKAAALVPEPRTFRTVARCLYLTRRITASGREDYMYHAMISIILQGSCCFVVDGEQLHCAQGSYALMSAETPGTIYVTEASVEKPFLCAKVLLDKYIIMELVQGIPPQAGTGGDRHKAIAVAKLTPEMLDAVARLIELLYKPERLSALLPLVVTEIYYHILIGPRGGDMHLFMQDNPIALAMTWLRANYDKPLRVAELAERICMAESTFHRRFRKIAGISPLQFQKQLRLIEAKKLMVREAKSAEAAAFAVGYDSPSQFNREYTRQFGAPPRRDIEHFLGKH
jgi:AraC-like DNA-binding protein